MISRSLSATVEKVLRPFHRAGCTADTRACGFERWGTNSTRPECCTSHLIELTLFAQDLLSRHGITYWLDFGTLLGAVRDGELIPWDRDVDFGILERDIESVLGLASEVEAAGHRLVVQEQIPRINYSALNTLHLDLFAWRLSDERLEPFRPLDEWPGVSGTLGFPRSFLEPPGTVQLCGREFPAPSPVDAFLSEHRYGPAYMTPKRQLWFRLHSKIGPDAMTPAVEQALDRLTEAEKHLLDLLDRSRLSRSRPVWLWTAAGLPVAVDEGRLERVRESVSGGASTPTLEECLASLALVEQAIDEFDHPCASLLVRRMHRRLVRATEALLAALSRRPHRAGFPFGT